MRRLGARWAIGAMLASLAVLGLTWSARAPAAAHPQRQEADSIRLSVQAGFDGFYKENDWLPVRITIANDGPDASGILRVATPRGFGSGNVEYTRALELPTQSRRELFFHIAAGDYFSQLKFEFVDGSDLLASTTARPVRIGAGDALYGVLAGSPSVFSAVLSDIDPPGGQAHVATLSMVDLPPAGAAWHGLDVIVISDVDTGALSSEQRAALVEWIGSGGRLIVAGGPAWQKTAAGLGAVLPVTPAGAATLPDVGALGSFAAAAPPVGEAVVALGSLAGDAVLLAEAGGPLVAMRSYGFGQVIYLAADPAFAPLRAWPGLPELFERLLGLPHDRPAWAGGPTNWSSARDAANQLPNLQLPNPLIICGMLGFYILVLGPINYLALRFFKRLELAWLTIPAIVCAFSGAAYGIGLALRGNQATLHQLSIVQVWPGAEQARVDQVIGVYSPLRTDYDVQFAPGFVARPLPDFGLTGGIDLRIEQGEQAKALGLRADIGGVQSLVAQGYAPAPRFTSDLIIEVAGNWSVRIVGQVANETDFALEDAVILAPGTIHRLGALQPGESRDILVTVSRASSSNPSVSAYGPYYSYDSTVDDILGSQNYYNDRELFRRYSLLSSAINPYGGPGRGGGVYLVGWVAKAPVSAVVTNHAYSTLDETVYFVSLPTRFDLSADAVVLTPGLMTWTTVGATNPNGERPAPYDFVLYPGNEFTWQFQPTQAIAFRRVQALTLHLYRNSSGPTSLPALSLWDFVDAQWIGLDLALGDNELRDPGRFVGPVGEIRVQLGHPGDGPGSVDVSRLDFTLTVER